MLATAYYHKSKSADFARDPSSHRRAPALRSYASHTRGLSSALQGLTPARTYRFRYGRVSVPSTKNLNRLSWRLPTFPTRSIIGSTVLNFSVRNGKRCDHCDKSPRQMVQTINQNFSTGHGRNGKRCDPCDKSPTQKT